VNKGQFANAMSLGMLPNSYVSGEHPISINNHMGADKNTVEDCFLTRITG
jgi:hypothetical protein